MVTRRWWCLVLMVVGACGDDGPATTHDASLIDAALVDAAMPDATPGDAGSTVTGPPLDPNLPTSFADATSFLYTDPGAIQTGVAPGTIDPARVVVLRGKVLDRAGAAIPGVTITILDHPELGQTLTRSDGMFDMAANGGGPLTVHYKMAAYLLAQRQVQTPVRDYVWLPEVTMVSRDATMTTIAMGAADIQVARGSMQSDASGQRRATVLFPAGTTGSLVQPDGSTQPAASLDVRLTEYTVGTSGPAAMPGTLPATSGFTYAVELGVDQAVAKVNGRDVVFDKTVYLYVENFLSFPVGEVVPVGYYDPAKSAWVGSQNGLVIKLLDASGALDVTGDNIADTGATLTALGITDAERAKIATLYPPGQSLWRTPMDHFSTIDCNWGVICVGDCQPPKERPPAPTCGGGNSTSGSIIGCERQTLGEAVALPGSAMTLHYSSDRVPGRTAESTLALSLGNQGVPAGVIGTEVEVQVAGQKLAQSVSATTLDTTATWNGQDAYGRNVTGAQPFSVRVGFRYHVVYAKAATVRLAWAALTGVPLVGNPARMDVTLYQEWHGVIRRWNNGAQGLGDWSLSDVHAYDTVGRILYLGDGTQVDTAALGANILDTLAGVSNGGPLGDGGPANLAHLSGPQGVSVAADGTVFIADGGNLRVRRIGTDGIIATLTGTNFGNTGDGGLATAAQFKAVSDVAVGPDGSVYIADASAYLVRRVTPDGIIHPFAGNGMINFSGDTGPATAAGMEPYGIVVGPDGSVYIADRQASRIRVVDQNGIINTFAGTNVSGSSGDGGPATSARLGGPTGLAFGPDGSLYIVDRSNHRIRKVSPQGIISTVVGNGQYGFTGDGGPATSAKIASPTHIAIAPDNTLYVADTYNNRIRAVGSEGIITTIAGTGIQGFSGDGGLAPNGTIANPTGIAVGADGTIFVSDFYNNRIRRLRAALPKGTVNEILVPSTSGELVYVFSSAGRHLRTLDALTGAVRLQLAYDAHGIASIDDGDGNLTTIERDVNGAPTALVAHGFRTTFGIDARGYLATITDPAGAPTSLVSGTTGLLTQMTDRRGGVHKLAYDPLGRLARDEDPAGRVQTLTRATTFDGTTITLATSLGHTTTYLLERLANGAEHLVTTDSTGAITEGVRGTDGSLTVTASDGSIDVLVPGPDPRFGMYSPILASYSHTTPGGSTLAMTATRTATFNTTGNPLDLATLVDTQTVNGHTWTRTYTGATRTIVLASPAGRLTSATLDARGRVTGTQTAGLTAVTYGYDPAGNWTSTSAGARASSMTYTAGQIATYTDPLGELTGFTRDAAGRVSAMTVPDSAAGSTRTSTLAYDAGGNVTAITPPGRTAHAFTVDAEDLAASYTAPGGLGSTTIARNVDHQINRVTLPDGSLLQVGYDGAFRISDFTLARGTIGFAYAAGRVSSITAPGGITETFAYDGDLPITNTLAGPVAGSVTRTYDAVQRLGTLAVNGANPITYGYDTDDLITTAGALAVTRHAQHGRITTTALGVVTDAWGYNGFGDPLTYTASVSGTAKYAATDIRDAAGRVTQRTETILGVTDVYTFTYDHAGRLIEVDKNATPVESYTYDANNNRLTANGRVATFDAQDRLMADGATTFAYAASGYVKTKGTASYTYDELGNLVGATLPSAVAIAYVVDGRNDRIGKRVAGALVQGFLYEDALRPIAELDGAGAIVSRFVYATRDNVPDYLIKGGATYRIVTDALGSPRLVIDTATGAIAQRLDYDAFGNVTADSAPGFQPFGFAGGLYDRDTKLTRFGARDYDAATGRWTAKDPVLFAAGDGNVYAYGFDDPVNQRDPDGLDPSDLLPKTPPPTKPATPFMPDKKNEFQFKEPAPVTSCGPSFKENFFNATHRVGAFLNEPLKNEVNTVNEAGLDFARKQDKVVPPKINQDASDRRKNEQYFPLGGYSRDF